MLSKPMKYHDVEMKMQIIGQKPPNKGKKRKKHESVDRGQSIEKERVKIHECKNNHCNRRISRSDQRFVELVQGRKKEMKKREQ